MKHAKFMHLVALIRFSACVALVVFGSAFFVSTTFLAEAATTVGIDDDAVISVEQAGSVAPSSGDYGWDSRGAEFKYFSSDGLVSGNLGRIMFANRSGVGGCFIWDEWGGSFPDWWGKMLADRIRANASDSEISGIRKAFANYMNFECTWIIAIGTKSSTVGGALYKTLRTDNTLRVAYGNDTLSMSPPEKLFTGNEMAGSLSAILPHEKWGPGSQKIFSERNPYSYAVRVRSYDVHVYATNCTICARRKAGGMSATCTHLTDDEFFCAQIPIYYDNKAYNGDMAFAWEGQTVNYFIPEQPGYVRNPAKDDYSGAHGLRQGNSIQPTADSVILLSYEKEIIPEKRVDVTVSYVILNDLGTAISRRIKESTVPDGILIDSIFSLELEPFFMDNGIRYDLLEGAHTAISYSSTPKFANAIKGTRAYLIDSSFIRAGRISYKTNEVYAKDAAGTLFVPVAVHVDEELLTPSPTPEITPSTSPTPSPYATPSATPTFAPDITPGVSVTPTPSQRPQLPSLTVEDISAEGQAVTYRTGIAYDSSDPMITAAIKSEIFNAEIAIPSTETVYISANLQNYLYRFEAEQIYGKWPVTVTVRLPFTYVYHISEGMSSGSAEWSGGSGDSQEGGEDSETYTITSEKIYRVTVFRDFCYLHLNKFAYYSFDYLNIGNQALNNKFIKLAATDYGIRMPICVNPMSFGTGVPAIGGNIMFPEGFTSSITAEMVFISDVSLEDAPMLSAERALSIAENAVGLLQCRNDELIFDEVSVLGDIGWHAYTGTETIRYDAFKPEIVEIDTRTALDNDALFIPKEMRNGRQETTTRTAVYEAKTRFGGASIVYNPVFNVNPINVHTPVYGKIELKECDSRPNLMFNQEIRYPSDSSIHVSVGAARSPGLSLHENDTCDFYLSADNSGYHPVYAGVLGFDYNYYANKSGISGGRYVSGNEVRFGCDVYLDVGDDRNISNDRLISAGTWHEVAQRTERFYVPYYVSDGDYCIELRTSAVNSVSREDFFTSQKKNGKFFIESNSDIRDYVAADSAILHVSGKIYGFRLEEVSDSAWNRVFAADSGAADGTVSAYLPNGLTTESELSSFFFYYTAGTKNELGLETGRNRRFILPLLNGSLPISSMQNCGMPKRGSKFVFSLKTTGSTMAKSGAFVSVTPTFYLTGFDGQREEVKAFYYKYINGKPEEVEIGSGTDKLYTRNVYSRNQLGEAYLSARVGYGGADVFNPILSDDGATQSWRFEYELPANIFVKARNSMDKSGLSQNNSDPDNSAQQNPIWLTVNFKITAYDTFGNEYISYVSPNGYCNMWSMEGQLFTRTDSVGNIFEFKGGDVICISLDSSAGDDKIINHVY